METLKKSEETMNGELKTRTIRFLVFLSIIHHS